MPAISPDQTEATARSIKKRQLAAPFGMTELRLSVRHWLVVFAIVAAFMWATPRIWKKVERFPTGPDYRLPYALGQDYWLYQWWLEKTADPTQVVVLGDSVVWGEYVLPNGTLSHFLSQDAGHPGRFVNAGMDGLFPLSLEGLVRYFGGSLEHRKVLLHCNLLWLTSPKADLSIHKEESFNHSRLVPQFYPRIPCYHASANERLSAIVEREVGFIAWVHHLQNAYFGQQSILSWTLADNGGDPPQYTNCYRFPLSQITFHVPGPPAHDPLRGPQSPRHKPWFSDGHRPAHYDWVPLSSSLQWGAFRRLVHLLQHRGNEVLVVLGPFNEHMVAPDSRPPYRKLRTGVIAWLKQNRIPYVAPATLPSALYADDCHPLTQGYALLAHEIDHNAVFQTWLAGH